MDQKDEVITENKSIISHTGRKLIWNGRIYVRTSKDKMHLRYLKEK